MSSVYATEPVTSGRVIFETTHGPLDILLWNRECPSTTKFFLQLCADGFYNNMLFHRIVPSLLIQTGAIRSGSSGDTISNSMTEYRASIQADQALERRRYETNARIRFNHRGQVAMALGVEDVDDLVDLQPQFFITTEDAPYLDGKHVVFGTLGAGPTVFNAIRICQHEVDDTTNNPVDLENAPRIISTKIMDNPAHKDIVPQLTLPWQPVEEKAKKAKKKRKGKLDVNVLSFGDEVEGITVDSFHDKQAKKEYRKTSRPSTVEDEIENDDVRANLSVSASAVQPIKPNVASAVQPIKPNVPVAQPTSLTAAENQHHGNVDETSSIAQVAKEEVVLEPMTTLATAVKQYSNIAETRRAKYKKPAQSKHEREEEMLSKLAAFRGKIHQSVAPTIDISSTQDDSLASRMARRAQREAVKAVDNVPTYFGQVLDDTGEEDSNKWLQTRFKCRKHMDHLAGDGRDADDYEVVDDGKNKTENVNKRHKHQL